MAAIIAKSSMKLHLPERIFLHPKDAVVQFYLDQLVYCAVHVEKVNNYIILIIGFATIVVINGAFR